MVRQYTTFSSAIAVTTPTRIPRMSRRYETLERWVRRALLFTGVLNLSAAFVFLPPFPALRALAGLPEAGHPFYGWLVAAWIFLFGLAYLWLGSSRSPERLFLAVAAGSKASFALLLIALSLAGELPAKAPLAGLIDLVLAALFGTWLFVTRSTRS
jgi:hypothetical protein